MNPERHNTRKQHTYIVFYKPYGVLSQFTDVSGRTTLSDFGPFPRDIYPVGRLDADSEGLLLLTDDNEVKKRLLEPRFGHERTYLAQVERIPSEEMIKKLQSGVMIDGKKTKRAKAKLLEAEPSVPPRKVPIRFRKSITTAWLELTITEGRNRQVRKMTAAVGHPTLRLIRIAHGPLTLADLKPGEYRLLSDEERRMLSHSFSAPPPLSAAAIHS
jgi:23S rRNA pseudouridine2457 synthase